MGKWFRKGKEGIAESHQVSKKQQLQQGDRGPIPFTLPYDSSAKFIFVDDPLFFLYLHTVKVGAKEYIRLTCIRDAETCPACESGDNPAYAVVGTVIDTRPYTKKDGTVVKFSKKPFIAKGKAREVLLRRLEENGGKLRGHLMKSTRGTTQTECNVGEDIQVLKKLDKATIEKTVPEGVTLKEWFSPLDYEKIFAPKSAKDMADLLGVEPPMGSNDSDDIFGDSDTSAASKSDDDDSDLFGDSDTKSKEASKEADSDVLPDADDDDASIDDLLD